MNRVLFARAVGVQEGSREFFVATLNDVLTSDVNADQDLALANRLAQIKAKRYLGSVDDFFLD